MEVAASELGHVIGHAGAKHEFLAAVGSGKLHHGWLLRGPRGVGKARLALQFAMHLLSDGDGQLSANAETPVGRLVVAGSHPDLRIVRRPTDDKGKRKSKFRSIVCESFPSSSRCVLPWAGGALRSLTLSMR